MDAGNRISTEQLCFKPFDGAVDIVFTMGFLSLLMVPIVLAQAYWLALLRLRRVGALQTWLQAVVLSVVFFVAIGAVMGWGSYYFYDTFPPRHWAATIWAMRRRNCSCSSGERLCAKYSIPAVNLLWRSCSNAEP